MLRQQQKLQREMECAKKMHIKLKVNTFATLTLELFSGQLHTYFAMAGASSDEVLLRLTLTAQKWARANNMDLSIRPLTLSSLGFQAGFGGGYVELDSQIKAARTRVLFEYVTCLVSNAGQIFWWTLELEFL